MSSIDPVSHHPADAMPRQSSPVTEEGHQDVIQGFLDWTILCERCAMAATPGRTWTRPALMHQTRADIVSLDAFRRLPGAAPVRGT